VYVSVTRTHDPLDQPVEYATFAGEAMLPWLEQIEGFRGLLVLSDASRGATLVLVFWESREVAEEHHAARMQFREQITAAVNVQVVEASGYEVMFAHFGPLTTDVDAREPHDS
jgi:heme-degrading monooxygenase HmoA